MSVAKMQRLTQGDRLDALERRADAQDRLIEPMAEQLRELFDAWQKVKTINWFLVKAVGFGVAGFGAVSVFLTIWVNAAKLLGN